VACSVVEVGENIMRAGLARALANQIKSSIAMNVLQRTFNPRLATYNERMHGRPGVACIVAGVGEATMWAGMAHAVSGQMQSSKALAVDSICEAPITDNLHFHL